MASFALAAVMGGAGGIRSEGVEKTRLIRSLTDLPLIGLIKDRYPDGCVRITRAFDEVERIIDTGIDIVAIDGTFREVNGMAGPEFIAVCRKRHPEICILADISTVEEAGKCIRLGADVVSTCLRGFTPATMEIVNGSADIKFIRQLLDRYPGFPVLGEGLIHTPAEAGKIAGMGVWAVVVGTAITRPHVVTEWFVREINREEQKQDADNT